MNIFNVINSDSKIIELVSISITVVALLISLAIIPFQRISESVSSNLYQIIIKNKKLNNSLLINLILGIFQIIILIFIPNYQIFEYISALILVLILINTYIFYNKTRKQLDIYDTCCPLIENDIQNTIKHLIKTTSKLNKNPLYQYSTLKQTIINAISSQDAPDNFKKGTIFKQYHVVFIYKFQNIYEVINYNIEKSQYGSYEKGVMCLFNCLDMYFSYIDDYYINIDNFYLDFLDNSKKIIQKLKSSSLNIIYYDLFLNTLFDKHTKYLKHNINYNEYIKLLCSFFFDNILTEPERYFDDLNKFSTILNIFIQKIDLSDSIEFIIIRLSNIKESIYAKDNSLNKSMINKTINIISYNILSNPIYHNKFDILSLIFEIQKSIDARKLLAPMLVFDSYTTHFSNNYDNDKTLGKVIFNLLVMQEDDKTKIINNLNRIKIINEIIDILINRIFLGGTHVSGIFDQLYKIEFELYLLLDDISFSSFFNIYWAWYFTPQEKNEYIKVFIKIYLTIFSFFQKCSDYKKIEKMLYSILKMFLAIIKYNNYSEDLLVSSSKGLFISNIVNNKRINSIIKKNVYIILKHNLSKKYINYLNRKIRQIQTVNQRYYFNDYDQIDINSFYFVPLEYYNNHMIRISQRIDKLILPRTRRKKK
ncbi:MAG: hypothetical protein A2015_10110 [Spirochaetes bacterium GWF1_31_7]|nr:MAG: hypothetical protein A2Y30_10115 [Spirochaetes bacterium GWE1_32_154]OHD51609.1 MAG: hypothetical protein A2015_10110 [Spirochaetes bacterium GWF1_31_7]OHD52166.1 MAG: hypothetical protein A2Y29_16985 [Spirochaetes bacterium GWE2_31_10]HBD94213.1 hypothetical protein [Spirochaetia bacterium]HBI39315.1 hypothetical protein [Spirochaetia bacterium]